MSQAMPSAPRILVFDSGVGGLSVFSEIQQKIPQATYLYASDNAAFPYGTKTETELIARVDAVLHKIIAQHPVDLMVIACNTASTLTLPYIREHFKQPVVGVVPAIKPAAALSKTQVIGLLATPATVARAYTQALINEHAPNATVISVGSRELVELAEHKLRGGSINPDHIAEILAPFTHHPKAALMDVLVLACTHFPLLRNEIAQHFSSQLFSDQLRIIDSGEAIARRVSSLLDASSLLETIRPQVGAASNHIAIFTADSPAVDALKPQLFELGFHQIDILEV